MSYYGKRTRVDLVVNSIVGISCGVINMMIVHVLRSTLHVHVHVHVPRVSSIMASQLWQRHSY